MDFTIKHAGSKLEGLDWFHCKHCSYKTPSETGMMIHIEQFHHHDTKEHTVKELQAIAKENGITIRGSKAEITARLEEAGIL